MDLNALSVLFYSLAPHLIPTATQTVKELKHYHTCINPQVKFYHDLYFLATGPKLLYVKLEHEMIFGLLLYLDQFFSVSFFSNNVSFDHIAMYMA